MKLKMLVGSGDKLGILAGPVLIVGLILNILFPRWFTVAGPPDWLRYASLVMLVPGLIMWLWSVVLILTRVPQGKLITTGPFALVKHPLYTGVALLVLPWAGFLLNTWLGAAVGAVLYAGCRLFSRDEEKALAEKFGSAWEAYTQKVKITCL